MEEEKKYIYNDKAERIKKMNRFYIGATIFLGILFLLYLWLRMANQNLVNATVYGNTVLIIGASVLNTIIYHKDHATAKLKVIATLEMGLEYLLVGVQTDAHFITYVLIVLVALQIPYYDEGGLKRTCVGVSILYVIVTIIQTNIRKEQISPKTSSFRGFLYIPINLSDTTKTHEISTVTNT